MTDDKNITGNQNKKYVIYMFILGGHTQRFDRCKKMISEKNPKKLKKHSDLRFPLKFIKVIRKIASVLLNTIKLVWFRTTVVEHPVRIKLILMLQ